MNQLDFHLQPIFAAIDIDCDMKATDLKCKDATVIPVKPVLFIE